MKHAFERIELRLRKHSPNQDPETRLAVLKRIANALRGASNERVGQRGAVPKVRKQGQPAAAR